MIPGPLQRFRRSDHIPGTSRESIHSCARQPGYGAILLLHEDRADRLELCEVALRLARLAVLGPRSINASKFTPWATSCRALGLDWDTTRRTVSMLPDKIAKALLRVRKVRMARSVSRTSLSQVLASLRHVCTCIRSARPFFHRLTALHRRTPRWGTSVLSGDARLDVLWFEHILVHGGTASILRSTTEPDVHIYMDASNTGLCAIHPAAKEFLRVQFDEDERAMIAGNQFSINLRSSSPQCLPCCAGGASWIPTRPPARLTAPLPRGRLTSAVSHHVATVVHVLLSASRLADRLQVQSVRLTLFAVHCWIGRLPKGQASASSIRSKLSHVRWYHRIYTSCDPQLTPSHGLVLAGMQRVSVFSKTREPVTLEMLQSIMESLDPRKPTTASLVKGTRRAYTLQVGDVKIRDVHEKITSSWDRASTVENCFRGSKNDQGGNSATRKLKRSDHATLCPARAALALLHHASTIGSSNKSPLCLVASGELLSADSMATALRRAAASLGANSTRISCHSLRSGAATALLSAGVDSTLPIAVDHAGARCLRPNRHTRVACPQHRVVSWTVNSRRDHSW
ncbi:Integrase-like, catalytic domain [Phytophthora cactorum]|nr:Integrase-like, catalytic domain [Phytophthora cactorum]